MAQRAEVGNKKWTVIHVNGMSLNGVMPMTTTRIVFVAQEMVALFVKWVTERGGGYSVEMSEIIPARGDEEIRRAQALLTEYAHYTRIHR